MLYVGDRRLRMRRAMLFSTGIRPSRRAALGHRAVYRYEVTFERGMAVGCGHSRSFLLAALRAITATYRNVLYQRQLTRSRRSVRSTG